MSEIGSAAVSIGSEIVKSDGVGHVLNDAWGVILGDRVAAWRLRNAARIQEKLAIELANRGLSLDVARLPNRFVYSWFNEASKQDEGEVQTCFARLLAGAASSPSESADFRLIELLGRFTANEALVIEFLFFSEQAKEVDSDLEYRKLMVLKKVTENGVVELRKGVEHLISIGVLKVETHINIEAVQKAMNAFDAAFQKFHETPGDEHRSGLRSSASRVGKAVKHKQKIRLTELGKSLVAALSEPNAKPQSDT